MMALDDAGVTFTDRTCRLRRRLADGEHVGTDHSADRQVATCSRVTRNSFSIEPASTPPLRNGRRRLS
jgi:hypothetical protein